MNCNIDLRYVLPPLISLLFMFLLPHVRPWNLNYDLQLLHAYLIHPFLGTTLLLFTSILVSLFLSVSTTVPLTIKLFDNTIRLRAGDFSAPVTVALLCSVFLPPQLFWIAYPLIVCFSPCFASVLSLLKCALLGFCCMLQAIPPLSIVFFIEQEHTAGQEPPQIEVEMVEIIVDP